MVELDENLEGCQDPSLSHSRANFDGFLQVTQKLYHENTEVA
jgi:hypothetical protein